MHNALYLIAAPLFWLLIILAKKYLICSDFTEEETDEICYGKGVFKECKDCKKHNQFKW